MNQHMLLIRHSLPDIDPLTPANQWHLSPEGWQRCTELSRNIAKYFPFSLFSSYETKAQETAGSLADRFGLKVRIVEGLQEHERLPEPTWEKTVFEARLEDFFNHSESLVFGLETADQAFKRFSAAVALVIEQCHEGNIAIVTHGTVLSLFVSRHCELEAFPFWKNLGLPSVTVLTYPAFDLLEVLPQI